MRIGKLRTKVEFQRRSLVQNPLNGELQPEYATFETCFADVRGIRGKEALEGTNKLNGEVSHRIYARAHSGFAPKPEDRVVFQNKTIELTSVVNVDERGHYYEILGYEDLNQ